MSSRKVGLVSEDLRNYPVVIWRVGEFFSALSTKDIQALRDYVNAGGGLFMASMELLSRLDEGGFTNFRKNILHVEDYDVDPGMGRSCSWKRQPFHDQRH